MERILGLDIGKQKIGIAMSDLLGMTAQPKATIRSKNLEEQMQKILDLIKENSIKEVVVGLPKDIKELIDSLAAASILETYLRQKENGVR